MAGTVTSNSGKKLIHSDVCDATWQWCLVGKRNLDKAIAAFKDRFNFEV
jgi:predicted DsbA family dithiol-disulfide isomerase